MEAASAAWTVGQAENGRVQMKQQYRVYYSVEGHLVRSKMVDKKRALALFMVHNDAFLVTKEIGWWQRVVRFSARGVPLTQYPR